MPGEALNPEVPLAAPVAPLRHNPGMRILLVEDEPEMAAWLVRALKQSGFLIDVAATAREAANVEQLGGDAHASCNRTCELGMTRATGQQYRHVLELLEEVTRP